MFVYPPLSALRSSSGVSLLDTVHCLVQGRAHQGCHNQASYDTKLSQICDAELIFTRVTYMYILLQHVPLTFWCKYGSNIYVHDSNGHLYASTPFIIILGTTQACFLGLRIIAIYSIILGPIVILYVLLFSVQQY